MDILDFPVNLIILGVIVVVIAFYAIKKVRNAIHIIKTDYSGEDGVLRPHSSALAKKTRELIQTYRLKTHNIFAPAEIIQWTSNLDDEQELKLCNAAHLACDSGIEWQFANQSEKQTIVKTEIFLAQVLLALAAEQKRLKNAGKDAISDQCRKDLREFISLCSSCNFKFRWNNEVRNAVITF